MQIQLLSGRRASSFEHMVEFEECIKIKHLQQYESPKGIRRRIPYIVAATIYRPPSPNNNDMLKYLSKSLTDTEGFLPGCSIIIAGDFNQLNIKNLSRQFQQLAHLPIRGTNTLDPVLTCTLSTSLTLPHPTRHLASLTTVL